MQFPKPSQTCPLTRLPAHAVGPHETPCAYKRQAPAPSHWPSRLQGFMESSAGVAVHSLSGSMPSLMGKHVPFAPPVLTAEQARQRPPHVLLQHTPSTQKPDWHCVADVHDPPFTWSGWHVASEIRQ